MRAVRTGVCLALMAITSVIAGCGSSDEVKEEEEEEEASPTPEQACLDAADALAGSAERCGFDYKANYDAFINSAAEGDCGNIVAIRDQDSFYAECLPFFEGLTCEQINDPALAVPASCVDQLLRLE